jgi:hypothetical protein
VSQDLTVGTPDANGKPPDSIGSVTLRVTSCPACANPLPKADVRITSSITDVRNSAALDDYTGKLTGRLSLRITDHFNGAAAGDTLTDSATVEDAQFKFDVPCTATSDESGSTCIVDTSANALVPGFVRDGDRSVWALGTIGLYDAGGKLFATQGVFAP